jgi:hypothetical protein
MSTRWPYEKFRHTLHVLRLATLGDAHQFSIAQLLHARHLLVQLGGLVRVGTLAKRTIVPRTAPALRWCQANLRQGSQMASQLELSARAALCKQLAKREPENRVLWMAEAENWSRLSNEKFRGEPEQPVTASWSISA